MEDEYSLFISRKIYWSLLCNLHVLTVYNTKLFLRCLMIEEKNSILLKLFLYHQEGLSAFMTRCCRRKNKALFMAMNCQIIRLDFYGTTLTCFESINGRSKNRKESTCPSDKVRFPCRPYHYRLRTMNKMEYRFSMCICRWNSIKTLKGTRNTRFLSFVNRI